ncbi:MAG: SRPBCC family protein [Actinomycetota bacterium]
MAYVNRTRWIVNATQEDAFALISDLTRSPEWATNPLNVVAETPGSVKVGSKYHSDAHFMGGDVHGEQEVTAYDPPARFSFENVQHGKQRYVHDFTVHSEGGKAIIERTITFEVPGFRGLAIRLVVPFLSKRFDQQASAKLEAIFPARSA